MPVTKVKFLSKVARITVASKPYQSLKNCWIGIVSLVLSMEPMGAYSAPIFSCISNDSNCILKEFSRIGIVFQFPKNCKHNWEIRAAWENNIMCHLSGLLSWAEWTMRNENFAKTNNRSGWSFQKSGACLAC